MAGLSRRSLFGLAGTAGLAAAVAPGGAAAGAPAGMPGPARQRPILTRRGTQLRFATGPQHRVSGYNAYWLGLDDNVRDASGDPIHPAHDTITAAFDGMRAMGATLVRAHTVGISYGRPQSFETAPGVFHPGNLDSVDWAVAEAKRHGIVLMVPITDQWNYYHGGKGVFVHWAYQQNPDGLTDVPAPEHLFDGDGAEKGSSVENQFFGTTPAQLRIRALFTDYLRQWFAHTNPYTGLTYAEDPTIAVIETGNEIYPATSEWTSAIAKFVKSVAPTKLLADGSAATGLAVANAPGLHVAEVDIVGAHYYAADANWNPAPMMTAAPQLDDDVAAAQQAGKVFLIGEYPWTRDDVAQWWAKVEADSRVAGDLAWVFIAGSEQHGGPFGSDDVAVHWPYLGDQEKTYAPALARHTHKMSGAPLDPDAA